MSTPDPKAWEITAEDRELKSNRWIYSEEESIEAIANAVARRRVLAELKALFPETYSPVVDQHYGGPAPRLLDFDVILARIAAIEAEEATPP